MTSKLITASMALAVLLAPFSLPAIASASPVLTESGVNVAAGSAVQGQNESSTEFIGGFGVGCSYTRMVGTVTENSGTSIKLTIPSGGVTLKGTATSEDCTSPLGPVKWTINSELCFATTKTADQIEVTGCEGKVVTFTLSITGSVACKYEASKVLGTFTTSPAEAKITITNQPASGEATNSFICPGGGELSMVSKITTTNGTGLTIS